GTGKELAAKALHRNSTRSQKEMYVVNCAAFTDTLLGSELFGHEKGAFTGADQQRKGLFEFADGGTVFLDEIGECSLKLQSDLLRLIQQGEFKRLGGNRVLRANVRIIAATNVDLENVIEGAIALGTSAYIGREDLQASLTGNMRPHAELGSWMMELNASKKAIIERTLQKTGGNRAEAARLLDLNPKYFSALCKE